MQVLSVALAASYSSVLSLQSLDTNGPIGFSLSVGQTTSDTFQLYGTLDSAAVDNTNAYNLGAFSGGAGNLPAGIAEQAAAWPFVLVRRTGGSTAGSLFVAGNPASSPAVVSTAAPVVIGNYSAVLDLTSLGAKSVRIGGSRQMLVTDVFDVYLSDDSALASLTGAYYAGRITGGGGTNKNTVLVSGFNYAIIRRADTSTTLTAGTIIAAGVFPSAGGGSLSLNTLAVADTAVNGPIGALTAAQTVDIYSSFRLLQTTASVVATLPNPTVTTPGRLAFVMNNDTSTQSITMYGMTIGVGAMQAFEWDGSAWLGGLNLTQGGNSFGAAMRIGTNDANNVAIWRQGVTFLSAVAASLTLGDTTGAYAVGIQSGTGGIGLLPGTGPLNLGTDATDKTITIGSSSGVSAINVNTGTGGLSLGTNATAHAVTMGTLTGASLTTIQGGTSGVTVQPAATGPVSITTGTTGALTLDSGSTGAIDVGVNANAKTITIGNSTGATVIVMNAGTGGVDIGTNAVAHTIRLGNSTGATGITIDCGTGALNVGTNAVAHTVTIGNGTGATSVVIDCGTGALNIGTNAVAHTITMGNTTGATRVRVNVGTGGFGVNVNPDASAFVDFNGSTTQAVRLTNMTTAERDAIAAPATGLIIYNTTTNKLNFRAAAAWEAVTSA